jgi:hypothetical protein
MKFFRLSTGIRQPIILVLVIAILWQSKSIPGPDGLVEAKIEILTFSGGWCAPKLTTITAQKWEPATRKYAIQFEMEEVLIASSIRVPWNEWIIKAVEYVPWLDTLLPDRLTGHYSVYDVVVRIKPEQWELLEEAKRKGYKFCCSGGTFTY